MYKHTFYYFLGNKKYPEIYILHKRAHWELISCLMHFVIQILCRNYFTIWREDCDGDGEEEEENDDDEEENDDE